MKCAYAYIRVSGKGQIKGTGLDRQKETILNYAKQHGYEIVTFYRDEGVSGTNASRPALASDLAPKS